MARRHRKTVFEESASKNNITFNLYVERLTELSLSLFSWKNLPETCNERFLELALFEMGSAVFFRDDVEGFLALKAALGPSFDVYNIPKERHIYTSSGYTAERGPEDSVIIYNNRMRTPSILSVRMFAGKLAELDRIIEVNARAQKTPVLVQGTDKQRLTLLNLYKEYDGNAPVIFGDKNLDLNSLKAIATGAPYVADRLYDLKVKIWNEALTYLGIANLTVNKKANLTQDEVQRYLGGSIASRYSRLIARQTAAEEINRMFGLDISVSFREDPQDVEAEDEPEETEAALEGGNADE